MKRLDILLERLTKDGFRHTALLAGGRLRSELDALAEDIRRGVSTKQEVDWQELGFEDSSNHAYVATTYAALRELFGALDIDPARDVFVDMGSGKGRVVMMAAGHPFRRVMGVEYSEALHRIAQSNLHALRNPTCGSIELICADASKWPIPDDVTVLFFFNPFHGQVLADVVRNTRQSLSEAPRKITIVYVRPDKFFEREIEWQSWLRCVREFPYSDGKSVIYESL